MFCFCVCHVPSQRHLVLRLELAPLQARMTAMQAASDNADDLVKALSLQVGFKRTISLALWL
jgi:hypothetical protein